MKQRRENIDAGARMQLLPIENLPGGLRIDRLRRGLGVTSRAIRYYEELGLLPPLPRNEVGYRVIPKSVLPRLRLLLRARSLGFSLKEIREILDAADTGNAVCPTTQEVIRKKRASLRQKIRQMQELERLLQELEALCKGNLKKESEICPAIMESKSDVPPHEKIQQGR